MVFANADEAAAFTGTDNPEAGLTALAECCQTAAVKLGAQGPAQKRRRHLPRPRPSRR